MEAERRLGKREERLKVADERKGGGRCSFGFLWFWPEEGRVRVMIFRVFCGSSQLCKIAPL